ncbi:MAG: RecX family transcriptional regulator [Clostridia bacterium]|nr:RecX family transcriptional regulator [Clostridia bacterium]
MKMIKEKNMFSEEILRKFEEFDKLKTKVLRYILYRKRTEQEVRKKFEKEIESDVLNTIIDDLKQNSYINDEEYIKCAVREQMNLNTLSIKEIKYKLYTKGLKNSIIESYIERNMDELQKYEEDSAKKIFEKQIKNKEIESVKIFLLRKGYKKETIEKVSE